MPLHRCSSSRPYGRTVFAAVVVWVASLPGAAARTPEPAPEDAVATTRATLAQWMEIQQIIARERKDWQTGKDVLEQRIRLLGDEIDTLEGKIREARESLGEVGRKRTEVVGTHDALRRTTSMLVDAVARLETRTRALVEMLPDPLRQRVSVLSGRIPIDPEATAQSLGMRYQNVIGVLNEINKFNQDITVVNEIREIPGGGTAEVSTIYLGLGQAWYVTVNGDTAGVGLPGPAGWEWTVDPGRAADVSRALRILRSEEVPAYVSLPVSVR